MGTTAEKLQAILNSKAAIKASIEAKGQEVGDIPLSQYAAKIDAIETGGGGGTSKFYLNKCVLTDNDGYQIEKIPIKAGDMIDLGAGEDVPESTKITRLWHPAMIFEEWASSIDIVDNQFVVPDDICTDYHCGAIYKTADDKNWQVWVDVNEGVKRRSDENTTFVKANTEITAVWLRSEVTSIGNRMFYSCQSLTSVSIPSRVTSIGNEVFLGCYFLTCVSLPSRVTIIGEQAFYICRSLTSISLPNGVNSIVFRLFYGCSSLTSVIIPSRVTSIGNEAFAGCSSLTSISLPSRVTIIGEQAFASCFALTSIILPNGMTIIGGQAFAGCSSLDTLIFEGALPPTIETSNEMGIPKVILVPEAALETYKAATNFSSYANKIFADTPENRIKYGLY